jgi:branched-chain amino acid transport system ATP-binding protein
MTGVIGVEHLEVRYGDALALSDVSFELGRGSVTGIVGPNGSGKTTLLRALSGALRPTKGRIVWKGEPLGKVSLHGMVAKGIVHVPEGRRLITDLSVRDNLKLGAVGAGLPPGGGMERVLELFPPVVRLLERQAGQLSGGEQQMVAIGRGLMAEPELMMIDELSLGLAPKITVELLDSLKKLSRDTSLTILLVDQNARLLSKYVTDLLAVSHGKLKTVDQATLGTTMDAYVSEKPKS